MNDHQQVAGFILSKLRQAPMIGDESEVVSSAKQWLGMIQRGQLQVTDMTQALEDKVPPELKPLGNGEDLDDTVHE